jgi:hypothetical protein
MSSRSDAARRTVLVLALTALLAAFTAACSSSEETATPDTTAASTTTTATGGGGGAPTTAPRQPCSAQTLGAAALASFEAPALIDVVCETDFATATLSNGPGGELLVLFQLQDGAWALVGSGPVNDLAAVATPASFSTTAIPAWLRLRDARILRGDKPPTEDAAGTTDSTRVNSQTGGLETCVKDGDFQTCTAVTTTPPAPPAEPTDPDAEPPATEASMFCRYNYNDPRCKADPSFTPPGL